MNLSLCNYLGSESGRETAQCLSHDVFINCGQGNYEYETEERRRRKREMRQTNNSISLAVAYEMWFCIKHMTCLLWLCSGREEGTEGMGGELGYLAIYNAWLLLCVFAFNNSKQEIILTCEAQQTQLHIYTSIYT